MSENGAKGKEPRKRDKRGIVRAQAAARHDLRRCAREISRQQDNDDIFA